MDIISKEIQDYIETHTSPENEVLTSLDRETNLKVLMPNMISGHVQGRLLSLLSKLISPNKILEIGTFTGYASICLAEGLKSGGKLITIDKNAELEYMVRTYFKKAGIEEKVNYIIGKALEIIPQLHDNFDLIFIDADKVNYLEYYKLCLPKLSENGLMIADNVLWKGDITKENPDKKTRALQEFNEFVNKDTRVENVMLSVRDGLMLIRKK